MQSKAQSVDDYIKEFDESEQVILNQFRKTILNALPKGYEEAMQYGMISYQVPLSYYPKGYLNDKENPLPYIALAKQKHHYAFYSMAAYGSKDLFEKEKEKYEAKFGKLDHGASCIRFKSLKKIDFEIVKNLTKAMSMDEFIALYEMSQEK